MSETAFRFLLQNDRQPFRPSRCYIVADPKMDDRTQWTLELDAPEDAPWIYELDDIKDWMLHGDDKHAADVLRCKRSAHSVSKFGT